MVTQQPLWKQFMALVSCLGHVTSANTNSGRLKAVSKHPKGWTKWKSCMQVWGASGGEQCMWGKLPLLLCWLCVPRVSLSFLGLPALLLTHSLNPQEVEKQRTTQRLVGHEPSASSLAGVRPPQENVWNGLWVPLSRDLKGKQTFSNAPRWHFQVRNRGSHGTHIMLQSTLRTMPPSSPFCTSLALAEHLSCMHAAQKKFELRKLPRKLL